MRIKQLELVGFKSFKNKTTLSFPKGITAVVGPNGCGKSNIVDALRWVLGEQSAKQLRGQEMSDVVFAGNQDTAPLGMADVSLLLEDVNEPGSFPNRVSVQPDNGNSANWSEIMVSRRYFRSGDSEYLFNKIPCRLRDVVEFFLGTGAGTKAYSIIEQGRVDALINAKSEDVRMLVEEAAGVSLYRNRRLAAERKLERTRENLSRVSDLIQELERQTTSLRRQAQKAARYNSLKGEIKELDLVLQCRSYAKLSAMLEDLMGKSENVQVESTRLADLAGSLHDRRKSTNELILREEDALSQLEDRMHDMEGARRLLGQKRGFAEQQIEQAEARILSKQEEANSVATKRQATQVNVTALRTAIEKTSNQIGYLTARLNSQETSARETQAIVNDLEAQVEETKTVIVELMTSEAQVKNTLDNSTSRSDEITERLGFLRAEAGRFAAQEAQAKQRLAEVQKQSKAVGEKLEQARKEMDDKSAELSLVVSENQKIEGNVSEALEKRAELSARLSTLEEMEREYDRYDPAVQSAMAEHEFPSSLIGVVAQMVEVPEEYERAVAAVLREKLEYMIVPDVSSGVLAVDYLKESGLGHGGFFPIQTRDSHVLTRAETSETGPTTVGEGVSRLISCVDVEDQYSDLIESLLGQAVLVPNLKAALELYKRGAIDMTYVTRDGDVISAAGSVSGGSGEVPETALLERRREIRGLRKTLVRQDEIVASVEKDRAVAKDRREELQIELREIEQDARSLTQKNELYHREAGQLEGEYGRLLDRGQNVSYELRALVGENESLLEGIAHCRRENEEIAEQRIDRETVLNQAKGRLDKARVELDGRRIEIDGIRVKVAENKERHEGLQVQIRQLENQVGDLDERKQEAEQEISMGQENIIRLQTEIANFETSAVRLDKSLSECREVQSDRRAEYERLRSSGAACENEIEEARQASLELNAEKGRIEVERAEMRVNREHVELAVRDGYGLEVEEVCEDYSYAEVGTDEAESQLESLREKLAKLGEVNPGAVSELASVEERMSTIDSQKADLLKSINDLENTINKLNRESRDRFHETLQLVDGKFREVYAQLVEGGAAGVRLTNKSDFAESGVDLEVQPPGKRLRSMQLLSGGEKALAALSFTFALFLIRPSPFCILDEVDAPLDDANIGRFNQLLRAMSRTTQIVLITHNKRTMEVADTLYGVTMQEPGVSTMVSVRVA